MSDTTDSPLMRFIDHLARGFTPELARHFAELPQPDPDFQARLDNLAEKANEGTLASEECAEYEEYIQYMDFIALLRLKARVCAQR